MIPKARSLNVLENIVLRHVEGRSTQGAKGAAKGHGRDMLRAFLASHNSHYPGNESAHRQNQPKAARSGERVRCWGKAADSSTSPRQISASKKSVRWCKGGAWRQGLIGQACGASGSRIKRLGLTSSPSTLCHRPNLIDAGQQQLRCPDKQMMGT